MEELNFGPPKTNPVVGREKNLNPAPRDYKSSILTRPRLPPGYKNYPQHKYQFCLSHTYKPGQTESKDKESCQLMPARGPPYVAVNCVIKPQTTEVIIQIALCTWSYDQNPFTKLILEQTPLL